MCTVGDITKHVDRCQHVTWTSTLILARREQPAFLRPLSSDVHICIEHQQVPNPQSSLYMMSSLRLHACSLNVKEMADHSEVYYYYKEASRSLGP